MNAPHRFRSWGGLEARGRALAADELAAVAHRARLTRGLGRSYGDATLPVAGDPVAEGRFADRLLSFDPDSGVLRAEAGLSLHELNRLFLDRGWGVPVSPGTQFVTLGGMVAADVHGKNHHMAGCFGRHVRSLRMLLADGAVLDCSRERHRDLFLATLGGMGLTGHVLEVEFALEPLPSPWIHAESFRVGDLDELLERLQESSAGWPFTAAWVDCLDARSLGRGVIHRGRWAWPDEAPATPPRARRRIDVPFTAPDQALGRWSLRAFNAAYWRVHPRNPAPGPVAPVTFFYPLDAIGHWNRLYGRRGFTQYQFVVPREAGAPAVRRVLETFVRHGGTSFLSVVKDCGPEGQGLLSFPRSGTSVALDLPFGPDTRRLVDALDAAVIEAGGRIYLAKDALTRREHFLAMEPRLDAWLEVKERWDPQCRLRSALWDRLLAPEPGAGGHRTAHASVDARTAP